MTRSTALSLDWRQGAAAIALLGALAIAPAADAADVRTQTTRAPGSVTAQVSIHGPVIEAVMATPQGKAAVDRALNRGVQKLQQLGRRAGRNSAFVDQTGTNGTAIVGQSGGGHTGAIVQSGSNSSAALAQRGTGHSGAIVQPASNSALGLVQVGRCQNAAPVQTQSGEIRIVLQAGVRC